MFFGPFFVAVVIGIFTVCGLTIAIFESVKKSELNSVTQERSISNIFTISGVIVTLGLVMSILPDVEANLGEAIRGFGVEVVGATVTVGFVAYIVKKIDNIEAENRLYERLMRKVRSSQNVIATDALDDLRYDGWLNSSESLFKDEDMAYVKWQNADLSRMNLSSSLLQSASLDGANLESAILSECVLSDANLHAAKLLQAELMNANLFCCNLSEADLRLSNLDGAKLEGADLTNAKLNGSKLTSSTILPDGTLWNNESETGRFTDPNHAKYWRSDDEMSPAYSKREKSE